MMRSIDNFGDSCSSLPCLRRFPRDKLKLTQAVGGVRCRNVGAHARGKLFRHDFHPGKALDGGRAYRCLVCRSEGCPPCTIVDAYYEDRDYVD